VICVDAGLVIRRVLFPDDTAVQQAWDAWEESNEAISAPTLVLYEVTNALYRYQRQGLLSAETVNIALQAALALPIQLIGDAELHLRAKSLAVGFNLPAAYDAHYLALAERLGSELWTADKRLVQALASFKLRWIRAIG
jgi:predicted nucleic acid-binding protein